MTAFRSGWMCSGAAGCKQLQSRRVAFFRIASFVFVGRYAEAASIELERALQRLR